MTRSLNHLRHTATHEAGHAVIGRVLALSCGGATIRPDYKARTAGIAIIEESYTCDAAWEERGKICGSIDAVWHAKIMSSMAGAEAEIILLGATQGGDSDDRCQIERLAEELSNSSAWPWERIEGRLRAMTRMLVRRHRALIERLAAALLKKKTLSGAAIDKLIGRSINDVRPNLASVLEMRSRYILERQSS